MTEKKLKNIIRRFIESVPLEDFPDLKGIISPHAGYIYSGPIAAFGYKQLKTLITKVR